MKIIEALKEIPLIEKKIEKNCEDINKYSSYCVKVGPSFKDRGEQEKQVTSLIKSNNDLVSRRLTLKRVLAKTNATAKLTINDVELTIVEWLEFKNIMGDVRKRTYTSLSNKNALIQLQQSGVNLQADADKILVINCFDEKVKNAGINSIQETLDKISGALEVFNATTDLVEEV